MKVPKRLLIPDVERCNALTRQMSLERRIVVHGEIGGHIPVGTFPLVE